MTERARLVLQDCRVALNGIDGKIQGEEWRIRWVSLVSLLRTVGYVLKNVDSKRSDKEKSVIVQKWGVLNDDKASYPIFWEFIDKERHNIAHEYEVNAGQGITIQFGGPTTRHYSINAGAFQGQDQISVAREAIDFWESYLNEIDEAVKNA